MVCAVGVATTAVCCATSVTSAFTDTTEPTATCSPASVLRLDCGRDGGDCCVIHYVIHCAGFIAIFYTIATIGQRGCLRRFFRHRIIRRFVHALGAFIARCSTVIALVAWRTFAARFVLGGFVTVGFHRFIGFVVVFSAA